MLKKLIAVALVVYLFLTLVAAYVFMLVFAPERAGSSPSFTTIENTAERKAAFFDYFLPLVEANNQRLAETRQSLLKIEQQLGDNTPPSKKQIKRLNQLAKQFAVEAEAPTEILQQLLLRVDEIPPAMVLAQAANESGWGRSRFAKRANNYFGQWCFVKGCGIVPSQRAADAGHEVRSFSSPAASVAAYFKNINTHSAYQKVRQIRAQLRAQQKPLSGYAMVAGLGSYSERGEAYIEELRNMIKFNRLE